MTHTFSMNSGSVETLKISVRCGCSPKALPNAHHRGLRQPARLSHQTGTPVRCGHKPLVQHFRDHGPDLRIPHSSRRPGTRLMQQAVRAQLQKPAAPVAHRLPRYAQLTRDLAVPVAIGRRPTRSASTELLSRRVHSSSRSRSVVVHLNPCDASPRGIARSLLSSLSLDSKDA
jgi:hypothetical protein